MADPVAAKSSFLCMYMSNHPDTLVSYVRHWGKIKAKVTGAQMTAIDTKGMSLTYNTAAGQNQIRIPFEPPLSGYEEVKPRLMNMKADAEEALGMVKAPQISSFSLPVDIWKTTILTTALFLVNFLPGPTSPSYLPWFAPAVAIRESIGWSVLKYFWIFEAVVHGLGALYMLSLCRKHSSGPIATTLYVVSAFIWSFPVYVDFRRRVQAARIDSIMKGK